MGQTEQGKEKLVFVKKRCHCETSAHTGRGNPPVERNQVTITTKKRSKSHFLGKFSAHFPSNRGIATPVCALVRNDSIFHGNDSIILTNTNSSVYSEK